MSRIEFHPVANIFPMMSAEEFQALKDDIQENGLLEPIWTHEDKIIDGRNRYLACEELDIIPTFREWNGEGSLVSFVVSLNLKRRHLDSGQKAFIGVDIKRFWAEEAKERMLRGRGDDGSGGRGNKRTSENPTQNSGEGFRGITDIIFNESLLPEPEDKINHQIRHNNEASAQAAKIVGTNRQYISDAEIIQDKAPEVAEAVKSGTIKIYEAKKVASLPEEQRKIVIEKVKSGEKVDQAIHKTKQDDRVANTEWTESELERKEMVEDGFTVVAHQNNDVNLIVWAEDNSKYVRIDRFSDWGNPFLLPGDGDRPTVIAHYKQYLEWRPSLLKRLGELKGKVLGCWCYPEECHGDVLAAKINEMEE